jgi:hypothetical protein
VSRRSEFVDAAVEAVWMCRLSESRILTPSDPPSLTRYGYVSAPGANPGWKYDYYSHILAAQRLLHAAEAISEDLDDASLVVACHVFSEHWEQLRDLRNVLQHPKNTSIRWRHEVLVLPGRIEHRRQGCDPDWSLSIAELHAPVEALWIALNTALDSAGTSSHDKNARWIRG